MADDADLANDLIELQLQAKLKEATEKPVPENDTEYCLNCGEKLTIKKRWCDSDCMIDYQRRNNFR